MTKKHENVLKTIIVLFIPKILRQICKIERKLVPTGEKYIFGSASKIKTICGQETVFKNESSCDNAITKL